MGLELNLFDDVEYWDVSAEGEREREGGRFIRVLFPVVVCKRKILLPPHTRSHTHTQLPDDADDYLPPKETGGQIMTEPPAQEAVMGLRHRSSPEAAPGSPSEDTKRETVI